MCTEMCCARPIGVMCVHCDGWVFIKIQGKIRGDKRVNKTGGVSLKISLKNPNSDKHRFSQRDLFPSYRWKNKKEKKIKLAWRFSMPIERESLVDGKPPLKVSSHGALHNIEERFLEIISCTEYRSDTSKIHESRKETIPSHSPSSPKGTNHTEGNHFSG